MIGLNQNKRPSSSPRPQNLLQASEMLPDILLPTRTQIDKPAKWKNIFRTNHNSVVPLMKPAELNSTTETRSITNQSMSEIVKL